MCEVSVYFVVHRSWVFYLHILTPVLISFQFKRIGTHFCPLPDTLCRLMYLSMCPFEVSIVCSSLQIMKSPLAYMNLKCVYLSIQNMRIYAHVCIRLHTYTKMCVSISVCRIHEYIFMYAYGYPHAHRHVYVHMYVCFHVHTHMDLNRLRYVSQSSCCHTYPIFRHSVSLPAAPRGVFFLRRYVVCPCFSRQH